MTPRTTAPPATAPPATAPLPGAARREASPVAAEAGRDVRAMSDEALVDLAVQCQVAQNAAHARRLSAMREYFRREEWRCEHPDPQEPWRFHLTANQSTGAEFGPALAVSDTTVEIQIGRAVKLMDCFPTFWAMCEAGRMSVARAEILLEAVSTFANEEDIPRFAELMDEFIAKHDDPDAPLCPVTRDQMLRAARYRKGKFPQETEEDSFAKAFARRRVSFRPDENGMGFLGFRGMLTDAMSADYRITLIAKQIQRENPDDPRTLDQLCADTAMDLLLGRLEVTASIGALEHADATGEADEADEAAGDGGPAGSDSPCQLDPGWRSTHEIGNFARPVINVTVPITTLMGISQNGGMLSGGVPIPAELARLIARDPSSTWYRMLTDPARRCVELSTKGYQPTGRIWREDVARDQTCIWPTCDRPAVQTEIDHRVEYPVGETSTSNTACLCKRHHKVKHSLGFSIEANDDASYTWTTRTGHRWTTRPAEQPVAEWPDPGWPGHDCGDLDWSAAGDAESYDE